MGRFMIEVVENNCRWRMCVAVRWRGRCDGYVEFGDWR